MSKEIELKFLIKFFSQTQREQWEQVPDEIPKVWVSTGDVDCPSDVPIRILALLFFSHLSGHGLVLEENTIDVLDEIRVLLEWYMLESNRDEIFTKRDESNNLDYIWRTLARLCKLALQDVSLRKINSGGITFASLLEKYTVAINQ